jgi:hypothetical protein
MLPRRHSASRLARPSAEPSMRIPAVLADLWGSTQAEKFAVDKLAERQGFELPVRFGSANYATYLLPCSWMSMMLKVHLFEIKA